MLIFHTAESLNGIQNKSSSLFFKFSQISGYVEVDEQVIKYKDSLT